MRTMRWFSESETELETENSDACKKCGREDGDEE